MKTIRLVLALGVIVGAVWAGVELIPPYFSAYQFQDAIDNLTLFGSYTTRTDDDIRHEVFKKAQDLDIPIQEQQIKIHRAGNNMLSIAVDYTVHVDLPGYPLDLQFHPASRNKPL